MTPNQFELQQLTGLEAKDEAGVLQAIQALHQMGPEIVVVTSSELGERETIVGYASAKHKDGSEGTEYGPTPVRDGRTHSVAYVPQSPTRKVDVS